MIKNQVLSRPALSGPRVVWRLLGALAALQICAAASAFCPQPLSPPDIPIRDRVATGDGADGMLAAWMETRRGADGPGPVIHVQRLDSAGAPQWGAAGVAITAESPQKLLLAPAGDGGALVAWQAGFDEIRIQRFNPAGAPQWAAGGVIVAPQRGFSGPLLDLVADGAGGAYVLHEDELNDDPPEDALLVTYLGAAGNFLWNRVISPECTDTTFLRADAVSDHAGGIAVVQEAWCGDLPVIRAYRLNGNGDHVWAAGGVEVNSTPSVKGQAQISASEDGNSFHVTWLDNRSQPSPDNYRASLYVQLLNGAGQPQWTANGVPASAELGSIQLFGSQAPRSAVLSHGAEVFLLWSNQPSPEPYWSNQITAQRLNGAGQPLWGNGVTVGTSYSGQGGHLSLVKHALNTVLAGWSSYEWGAQGTSQHNVYAQLLNFEGMRLWGDAPFAVATFGGLDEIPAGPVSPVIGRAFFFWSSDAMWMRDLPDWESCLRRAQKLRINAAGSGWQLLKYDYTTGQQGVTPFSPFHGSPTYYVTPGNWTGLFLYDYGSGRFSSAVYVGLDEVEAAD